MGGKKKRKIDMGNANSSVRKVSEQTGSDLLEHTIYSAVQIADYIIHEARKGGKCMTSQKF